MDDASKDIRVLTHTQRLVAEEQKLFEHGSLTEEQGRRRKDLQVELDQCWDLLRQRRVARDAGHDPSAAHVRPPEIVEKYIG
ncbi:MAG TPA: DUF2630 family protein [Burkholderiales bacterium]|nr:DUF2630 family protein [Burkholderiales bacterium]